MDNRTYFFQPKICWKAVGRKLAFALVESGVYLIAPASFISAGIYNERILAYLCSKLGTYYIYKNSDTTGAGDIMLNIQSLIQFPIPLESHIDIALSDEQVDECVFDSYGLSTEEVDYILKEITI